MAFPYIESSRSEFHIWLTFPLMLTLLFANTHQSVAQDCNENGIDDACDIDCGIAAGVCDLPGCGTSDDCNANGLPDECEVVTDFLPRQALLAEDTFTRAVFAADLDGDGDVDVLTSSQVDDRISWYENTDGLGTFGPRNTISTTVASAFDVFAKDLDGDGDADVLAAAYDIAASEIVWFENLDGSGSFGPKQSITTMVGQATCVYAEDLDGDGDADVLSASPNDLKIAWYRNEDGLGTFGPQRILNPMAGDVFSVLAVDLDGDGDPDVVTATYSGRIAWYENLINEGGGGFDGFGPEFWIRSSGANWARDLYARDLDGDGDSDILSASGQYDDISWYENPIESGQIPFSNWTRHPFVNFGMDVWSVSAADIDSDGDADVICGAFMNGLYWHENLDGLGTYSVAQSIAAHPTGVRSVFVADVDSDGDADLLSSTAFFTPFSWYENTTDDCNGDGIPNDCETDSDGNGIPDACETPCGTLQIGDVDANGVLEIADIGAFANVVLDPTTATADMLCTADVNEDAIVNGMDIQHFVELLTSP